MSGETIKANSTLGKDFLTYLCYLSDSRNGMFEIAGKSTFQVWLGDKIVLQDEADTPPNSVSFSGRDFTADDLKQAIKSGKGRDLVGELRKRGVIIQAKGMKTIAEEMPYAYKDVAEVVDVMHQAGISRKVARLRPLGVIKG